MMLININEEHVSKTEETCETSGTEMQDMLQEENTVLKARRKGLEEGRAEALEIIQEIKKEKMKAEEALVLERIKAKIALDQEKAKVINIAKNMLAEGLTPEQVLRISGISIKELWANDHCKREPRYSSAISPTNALEQSSSDFQILKHVVERIISLTEKKLIVAEEKAIKAEETLASEKLKMLNATKNMLAEGLTIDQVPQISGLSIEELGL